MSVPVIPPRTREDASLPGPRSRRRTRVALIAALVLVVAFGVAALVGGAFHGAGRHPPAFPSLAAQPDASLQGTVAYTVEDSRCVRIVAAAGAPSKDVLCMDPWKPNPDMAAAGFKEMNSPQLVWRADGRLEVTMFGMQLGPYPKGQAPVYKAVWQKIVDVRAGAVEDVPAVDLPASPNRATRPTTSPTGQKLSWESDGLTGRVKTSLTDSAGSRTLMSAHGPGEYVYALHSVFWAPNWQWIAADDGRILVITPGDAPLTRVLVDGGGGDGDYPTFAVTGENLLPGST